MPRRFTLTVNDTRQARRVQRPACQTSNPNSSTKLKLSTNVNFARRSAGIKWGGGNAPPPRNRTNYLISTFAPASSSFFLAASVSALLAPSSKVFGAPSTKAFASARPRPALTSRTALMTAIFLSAGTDAMITSKVSLAAAAGAAHAGSRSRSGSRDGRGGGNAPFGFQLFHQVGGFENRQLAQFLHEVCNVCHIILLSFVSSSASAAALAPAAGNFKFRLRTDDLRCCLLFVCSGLKYSFKPEISAGVSGSAFRPFRPWP